MALEVATGFEKRIRIATQFEERLFVKLKSNGFSVAMNGTEHTHPNFVKSLRQSNDQTSLAIRFQPDGVAQIEIGNIPKSFFWEAKSSKSIERTAFEQYQKLSNNGNIIVVIFGPFEWRWSFAEELPLIDGADSVASFPPDRQFPVKDGWLCPREASRRLGNGSGTPYRYVDGNRLIAWDKFKDLVISRMAHQGSN